MKRSCVGFAMALAALLAACGSSSDANSGKTAGAQGKAGSGGPKEGEVACGSAICKLPSGATGEACCKDQFTGACGIKASATAACRDVPKTDDRCPLPQLGVMPPMMGSMGMQTYGCCTANDECGIDFGAGCQPRTTVCTFVGPDQVDKIMPQTCDGDPLPLPANCGMNMIRVPSVAGQSGGT